MKLIDSDEEEEVQAAGDSAVTEREAIANELFEGGDDAGEVLNMSVAQIWKAWTHKCWACVAFWRKTNQMWDS